MVEAQSDPAPEILQLTEPEGGVAPSTPLTVAVYVIVPPKIGLAGEVVIAIVGVALATLTVIGEGHEIDE